MKPRPPHPPLRGIFSPAHAGEKGTRRERLESPDSIWTRCGMKRMVIVLAAFLVVKEALLLVMIRKWRSLKWRVILVTVLIGEVIAVAVRMGGRAEAVSASDFANSVREVRRAGVALDEAGYIALAKPSRAVAPATYGSVEAGLFDRILKQTTSGSDTALADSAWCSPTLP